MTWHPRDVPRITDAVAAHVPADGSDIVIFHDGSRGLHRLAGTAIPIWRSIDGVRTVDEIVSVVAAEHGVDPVDIEGDVVAMLDRLRDDEILQRRT